MARWQDPLVLAQTAEDELVLPLNSVSLLWGGLAECEAEWETPYYELRGYPTPFYSQELDAVVYFPPEPECR